MILADADARAGPRSLGEQCALPINMGSHSSPHGGQYEGENQRILSVPQSDAVPAVATTRTAVSTAEKGSSDLEEGSDTTLHSFSTDVGTNTGDMTQR